MLHCMLDGKLMVPDAVPLHSASGLPQPTGVALAFNSMCQQCVGVAFVDEITFNASELQC